MIITNKFYILTSLLLFIALLCAYDSLISSQNDSTSSNQIRTNQERNVNINTSVENNEQRRLQQQPIQNVQQDVYNNEPFVATLSNNEKIPLIGAGLEDIEHDQMSTIISKALSISSIDEEESSNLGYRLIDTSRISRNEKFISEAIASAMSKNYDHNPELTSSTTIHIVTKVWYTHLGYERTKISIQESLDDLLGGLKDIPYINVKVHFLIHWPKCYNEIKWMNCAEEEESLPAYIKELDDVIPHENPSAYLGSWRAMEDMYNEHYPTIASIGISNFDKNQLDTLLQSAKIKPHIYQGNLEMTSELIPLLRQHNIHPQKYGVFNTLTSQRPIRKLDLARRHLVSLAHEINGKIKDDDNELIFPETILISHFVENLVGIKVHTTSIRELIQSSPEKVLQTYDKSSTNNNMESTHNDRILHVLNLCKHPMNEKEEEHQIIKANEKVHVTFHNKRLDNQSPINIFFLGNNNDEESKKMVAKNIDSGNTIYVDSHPNHIFTAHDAVTGQEITKFHVNASYGRTQWFSVL